MRPVRQNSEPTRFLSGEDQGLCSRCGNPPAEGKKSCQICLDRRNALRVARGKQGLCRQCGKASPAEGKKLCQICLDRRNAWYEARGKQGLCQCGKASLAEGDKLCRTCLDRKGALHVARRKQGLCRCGKTPEEGKKNCQICLDRIGALYRKDARRRMVTSARHRAKKKGVPFSLTEDDIVIPRVCPVLGTPFVIGKTPRGATNHSPSLDRIIPALGYVPYNVRVVSHLANTWKKEMIWPEDFEALAAYARREIPKVLNHLVSITPPDEESES